MNKDTFFVPSFGNMPRELVGRSEFVNLFTQALESEPDSSNRAMLIKGVRGYGKTALLREFARIAQERGLICVTVSNTDTMNDDILAELSYALSSNESQKTRITGGSFSILGIGAGITTEKASAPAFGPSFQVAFKSLLDQCAEAKTGVVILIDEVTSDSKSLRAFASAYQNLKAGMYDLTIVMAGLPQCISSVINDSVLTFLGRANQHELGTLSVGEVAAYYTAAFANLQRPISPALAFEMAQASFGVPYAMQLIGHHVVSCVPENTDIQQEHADYAIRCMRQEYDRNVLELIIRALSPKDLEVLLALVEQQKPMQCSKIEEMLGMSHATFCTYRRRLLDYGIVQSPARGYLQISVPYLHEYVSQNFAE